MVKYGLTFVLVMILLNPILVILLSFDHASGAETIKLIPEHFITYKVLGEPGGPHFGHYDLVGSRLVCSSYLSKLFLQISYGELFCHLSCFLYFWS